MGLETRCVVAVDVGGTVLKGAVVDSGGKLILERRRATHREAGVEAVVATVVDVLVELAHEARRLTLVPCAAGLVVPGVVDEVAGIACYSANLGWRDLPLRDLVQAHLDLPLAFGHDVRAGGLAEAVRGAGRAGQDLLFLALGTGIAGALILRGEPYLGVKGLAGEIGHVQVESHGPPCPCGARGCLERCRARRPAAACRPSRVRS